MKNFFLLISLFIFNANAAVILIDPGHGGEDTGAKSHGKKTVLEKDLTLDISKKIQKNLQKSHTAFLTRSLDRTVTLNERSELADKVKADLFISVHINSGPNPTGHGFETYYLDNHDNVANKKVETVENESFGVQDKLVNQILIDLVIQQTVSQSKQLAQMIHTSIDQNVAGPFKLENRGVKPGLFYVLALSKRPGVLIEVGFLSNKEELAKMMNPKFQEGIAGSIARAIEKYLVLQTSKPRFN